MKKVHMVVGALGAAPLLGLMAPGASAATTGAHAKRSEGKKVSLRLGSTANPATGCASYNGTKTSKKGDFIGYGLIWHNSCLYGAEGSLNHHQSSLEMRTREYRSNRQIYSKFVHGDFSGKTTQFREYPIGLKGGQVCEALVNQNKPTSVKYGPVCETF